MTRKAAYNSTFAIGGVSCSADSFVILPSVAVFTNLFIKLSLKTRQSNLLLQHLKIILLGRLIKNNFFYNLNKPIPK
jgi:hypothetical protein